MSNRLRKRDTEENLSIYSSKKERRSVTGQDGREQTGSNKFGLPTNMTQKPVRERLRTMLRYLE
jgi:hypothetical protein